MIKNKIKILIGVFTFVILQVLFCFTVFSKNNVSDITYNVLIHDDGSATVVEKWVGTFNEGTENYIPIEDKTLSISNFNVSMNGKNFTFKNYWDVNGSFNDKKYKCGINKTYNGVELCFGISEYGNNTYTFTYKVSPLVQSFNDYDGFNFMFLNPEMNIYPSNVVLNIVLENGTHLSSENARIWGFGYDGEVNFKNGYVVANTDSKLNYNNYMTLMLRLDRGIINPVSKRNSSFASLQNRAFEGSTYEETLRNQSSSNGINWTVILFIFVFVTCIGSFIFKIVSSILRHINLNKFYKDVNYFRDTPNGGNMSMSHALFNDFDIWNSKDTNVIGAIIMKMIKDKNLEPIQTKSVGFFGIEKKETSLKLVSEPSEETVKELYNIIKNAAGADGILQENELKNYAKIHYLVLNNFLQRIVTQGRNNFNGINGYKKILGKNLKDLTDIGKKELSEVYGLRKFLDEFTLINEREIGEVTIWENLLIYATLFGLAKKVLKDLKKVYPDKVVEIENYSNTVYVSDVYFRALYLSSINGRRAVEAARMAKMAASGFGGHVSLGGGGGFSGGGHGGGSR